MEARFLQISSTVIPIDQIHSVEQNYRAENQPSSGPGSGSRCRVWMQTDANLTGVQNTNTPPAYYDFSGADAQAVRTWFRRLGESGGLIVLTEEAAPATTKAAGRG